MAVQIADFTSEVGLCLMKWASYPNAVPELQVIANALSTDQKVHDLTIIAPMQPLSVPASTPFSSAINLIVNKGKAGNLTGSDMANALASLAGPPVNFTAPVVTGTATVGSNLSCNTGVWTNFPSSYAYQWMRGSSQISGATNSVYALVGADQGQSVACRVTATNPEGSASATSNAIAVT